MNDADAGDDHERDHEAGAGPVGPASAREASERTGAPGPGSAALRSWRAMAEPGGEIPTRVRLIGRTLNAVVAHAPWLWPLVRSPMQGYFDRAADGWDARTGAGSPDHLAALAVATPKISPEPERSSTSAPAPARPRSSSPASSRARASAASTSPSG